MTAHATVRRVEGQPDVRIFVSVAFGVPTRRESGDSRLSREISLRLSSLFARRSLDIDTVIEAADVYYFRARYIYAWAADEDRWKVFDRIEELALSAGEILPRQSSAPFRFITREENTIFKREENLSKVSTIVLIWAFFLLNIIRSIDSDKTVSQVVFN